MWRLISLKRRAEASWDRMSSFVPYRSVRLLSWFQGRETNASRQHK